MRSAILVLGFLVSFFGARAQEIWTIGPMLHVNFGPEKRSTSFAIEVSYWNLRHFFYSVDGAIEFDRHKFRVYSELQTGIGITGLSLGPVLELGKGVHLGVQSTAWINYFGGLDYRRRWIAGKSFHAVGLYGKVPFASSGFEGSSGSSHHHYYHFHD